MAIFRVARRLVYYRAKKGQPTLQVRCERRRLSTYNVKRLENIITPNHLPCEFQQFLKAQGITSSMRRRGQCWDNAAMESFFSSLKTERTSRKVYRTREESRSDVFDYIERFYNPVRKHSKLDFLSPVQFEEGLKG